MNHGIVELQLHAFLTSARD